MKKYALFLLLALTAYAQQERVAIIQTLDNNDSISFNDLSYLTDKLRETAVKILPNERFGVMTTESIIAFLGSQERAVKVCNESSCLAELGRMVSADYVAQGRVGRFGKDLTIKVELYNVKTGTLMDSFTGDSKDIYGLRDIIDEKATDLFKKMLATTPPPKPVTPPPPPKPVTPPPAPQYTPPPPKDIPPQSIKPEAVEYVAYLIKMGFEKNKEEIQKESFSLSSFNKELLYEENKMGAFRYAVLNVVPGFGLGSYIQGDIAFGITQSVLDVAVYTFMNYYYNYAMKKYEKTNEYNALGDAVDMNFFIWGASRIIGIVAPILYQSKQNKALKKVLNINDDEDEKTVDYFSYSIDPLIIPRDGTPAVGLAFNVRY